MQADQEEDDQLADRLSSHGRAGFSQTGKESNASAPSAPATGSLVTPVELAVDMQDPLGMGVIDARNCTLVSCTEGSICPECLYIFSCIATMLPADVLRWTHHTDAAEVVVSLTCRGQREVSCV